MRFVNASGCGHARNTTDRADKNTIALHFALVDAADLDRLYPLLAAREGALVPVLETSEYAPIPLWRLVAERALCVNTTAAGGNASLMTLEA